MVAPLLLSLAVSIGLVSACSGTTAAPRAAQPPVPSPTASPSASSSVDTAAIAALARAETVVAATRSFTFTATEVLSGDASHATSVKGSVVRGEGVAYTLTANGRVSQVVRLARATYVRAVPGTWSKLRKPRPVTDPAGTLLAVLRGLTGLSLHANVVDGSLPAAAAKAAQLPAGPAPARVEVTLDAAGHVTKLVVATVSGATDVTLTTSYASFGRVQPLKPPA